MHKFSFNGQRKDENVIAAIQNHPFVLFWPGLKAVFFLVLGIATIVYISSQLSGLALVICVLVAVGIFSRSYYDYSQSVFVITNQRVINVDQEGFWKRKITETEIDKIQDAASLVNGPFRILLKYGDLVIRTAGASKGEEIVVKDIANPYEIQQEIAKLLRK